MGLKQNPKIYIDTNMFIYYFENNPTYANKVEGLFEEIIGKNIQLISSELLYLELLVLPKKENNNKIIDLYTNIEKYIPNLRLVPVSKQVLIQASEIKADYNLKSPDSIHLATAKLENCKHFYTSDRKLKNYKDVKVIAI